MTEQQNLQIIKGAYDAFVRGDIQTVLDALTEDVQWEIPGPAEIPYAGVYHGKSGVAQFFRLLAHSDEIEIFQPERFFAEGDMVVVLGRYSAIVKKTGKPAKTEWVQAFTLRDGKVAKWHEYLDTGTFAAAYEQAPAGVG